MSYSFAANLMPRRLGAGGFISCRIAERMAAMALAMERAPAIGFGRYIISATTPFVREDVSGLRKDAPAVVERHIAAYREEYRRRREA